MEKHCIISANKANPPYSYNNAHKICQTPFLMMESVAAHPAALSTFFKLFLLVKSALSFKKEKKKKIRKNYTKGLTK